MSTSATPEFIPPVPSHRHHSDPSSSLSTPTNTTYNPLQHLAPASFFESSKSSSQMSQHQPLRSSAVGTDSAAVSDSRQKFSSLSSTQPQQNNDLLNPNTLANTSAAEHQNILRSTCVDMNFDPPATTTPGAPGPPPVANNTRLITNISDKPSTRSTDSKVIDKQSLDYVIRSSIAGGVAGTSAKTLIAPLDRVKILFQTSNPEFRQFTGSWLGFYRAGREIYRTQGFLGLFQGHSATLLRIFPYAATKFVMYEQVRAILIPDRNHETSVRRFMAGSISGVTSVFVTYPLDLVRVRLAFETKALSSDVHPAFEKHRSHYDYKGGRLTQAIHKIFNEPSAHYKSSPIASSSPSSLNTSTAYSTLASSPSPSISPVRILHGLSNFYRGFTPTIVGMIPYAGVSFWAHDLLHDVFRSSYLAPYAVMDVMPPEEAEQQLEKNRNTYKAHRQPLSTWAQLTAGGLAGMMAQTASYPLEVVRRRIQVSGVTGEGVDVFKTVSSIYRQAGLQGFFVGLSIGYIKVIPMFACSFFVYERLKSVLRI